MMAGAVVMVGTVFPASCFSILSMDDRIEATWAAKELTVCQDHSSLDAPSELNPPQRIPSPLSIALLVPQAEG